MTVLADPPAGRPDVAVVRQPIADERHAVVGYEPLFDRESPSAGSDAKATSALLVDAFGDIGLEVLAGRHPAWMSIARNFPMEIGPPPVRPDRAVLQIASYAAREDMLAVLHQLGRSGYTLALVEYDGSSDVEPLLGLCSIVKVDVDGRDDATLASNIAGGLMGSPMEDVLESLPISDEIRAALLRHEGPKGELLTAVLAYERGEFPSAPAQGVSLAGAYRAALEWADEAHRAVTG